MILFFAQYPTAENERDGMIQRVVAIDSLFTGRKRAYICSSYRRNWKRRSLRKDEVTVHYVNFFIHLFFVLRQIWKAEHIYIHSAFNVIFSFPAFFLKKRVVTDIHGVVPEEAIAEGKYLKARIFAWAEKLAVTRSIAIVSVTQRMDTHLRRKYKDVAPGILLPIFDARLAADRSNTRQASSILCVIYAGGTQVWQNVDLMLETVQRYPQHRYLFLTPRPEELQRRASGKPLAAVTFGSATPNEVFDYYRKADLGFLLRDDSIINNVACPTKAIEYLLAGVVPIVLNSNIGDFESLGARFCRLEDLSDSSLAERLGEMRSANFSCIERLAEVSSNGRKQLLQTLR